MSGWIKLHRKILENGLLKNHKLWVFWTYCLLKAGHKKHKQMVGLQEIHLNPGQFVFGRKQAGEETGLTEQQIRTCLKKLKATSNLTIKSTNKFSIVTICNWEVYQGELFKIQPAKHHQVNHKQEDKNKIKKESGEIVEIPAGLQSDPFLRSWDVFKTHRNELKRPLSFLSAKTMLRKLEGFGAAAAAEMLDAAVIGGWPDVIPPKQVKLSPAQMNQGGQNWVIL